ncbi:MAG: NAD(P)/FAD-dependent oxidoreductase [Oscillospiraceae bacterium]
MIKITNLRLPPLSGRDEIRSAAAKKLQIPEREIDSLTIVRSSIDARRGRQPSRVCSVLIKTQAEKKILCRNHDANIVFSEEKAYVLPEKRRLSSAKPVIVGMGPAGLFAAMYLMKAGIPCIVLERGGDIDSRAEAVEHYWQTGVLDKRSNVQFGEGGAGAFSDGKLTTGTHDERISAVLQTLYEFGAPEDILWSHKPHIGTDVLREVVRHMRTELIDHGCDVRFFHQAIGLHRKNGALKSLIIASEEGEYVLNTDTAVFAIGHSARDSFEMLHAEGLAMQPKPFAMGVRIEHRQSDIGFAQLGALSYELPPTDYKLTEHLENGRTAFSFCVCPGGVVIASASDDGEVVTNGMSFRARGGENINGALLVGVNPDDYGADDALAGVRFQLEWERRAFTLGGENGSAPAQTVGDFLINHPSEHGGSIMPSYRPGVKWTDLSGALPDFVSESLRLALPCFGKKIHGFDIPDAVLTGIESRSSSPVRILRGENFSSAEVRGLYPCGEGAGYAGGIVSAAVDGIRVAESIITTP